MQATMTVRTDAVLKKTFSDLCQEFGMSANTAMNVFMHAVVEAESIPFKIGLTSKRQQAIRAFEAIREASERNTDSEMSIEEINAEIAAYRAERKVKAEGVRA